MLYTAIHTILTRRGFFGLVISSMYVISASPLDLLAVPIFKVISREDKRTILDYVYNLIDHHFNKYILVEAPALSHSFRPNEFKMVWVSFLKDRRVIACKGNTCTPPHDRDAFLKALKNATKRCIKDTRFVGKITEKEVKDIEIVIHLNKDIIELRDKSIPALEQEIELGVHTIKLELDGKRAWYLEHVPVTKNWNLKKTLTKLAKKAKLPKNTYKNPKVKISKSNMFTFKGKRSGKIDELFRYNIPMRNEDMSQRLLLSRLSLARNWFLANVDKKTKRVKYLYYPVKDKYSKKNNEVRNLAVLYILPELNLFLNDGSLDKLIRNTTDYYMTKVLSSDGYSFIHFSGDSKISYNAFMILSLINQPGYRGSIEKAKQLAEGILRLQKKDGSYATTFDGKTSGINFYPGEAMLSLMRLFEKTGDERLLDSVKRAFPYYRDYWWKNKNTAFVPWHTQTYYLLAKSNRDRELEQFVYEMNDWLIDTHQIVDDIYPDKIGGFKRKDPRYSTSSYMESVNDAYRMALLFSNGKHIQKYRESIMIGTRFILQTQFTTENAFWVKNPERAVGGFRESLKKNSQRNDYTQHAVSAILKAYRNKIFS